MGYLDKKHCYPNHKLHLGLGLTFKERLIISLASNPNIPHSSVSGTGDIDYQFLFKEIAKHVVQQANAIIKEMEEENEK